MNIHVIRTGVFGVNTYIVPLCNGKVFVVDPAACALAGDESKITDYLKSKKLECVAIILTHSHFDHVMGIAPLKKMFPKAVIAIHEAEFDEMQDGPGPMNQAVIGFFGALEMLKVVAQQPAAEVKLRDGMNLGPLAGDSSNGLNRNNELQDALKKWTVVHTPGHTPGSICLYNKTDGVLISGDTLFDYGGYGRTDMYGGDEAEIMRSLSKIRKEIPEGTKVYPGHDSFGFAL